MPLRFDGDIGLTTSYDHELSKGLKGGLSNLGCSLSVKSIP